MERPRSFLDFNDRVPELIHKVHLPVFVDLIRVYDLILHECSPYPYKGVVRKYYPDFIIKLHNGEYLILETKGKDSDLVRTNQAHLQEWVKAVNNHRGFGVWHEAISYNPNDLKRILEQKSPI